MVRLLLGLVKGAVVGAGLGFGAWHLGLSGAWGWIVYGAVGAAVGFLVGRPIWSHLVDSQSTVWTSFLKAIFGFGVGVGLYAIGRFVAPNPEIAFMNETHRLTDWAPLFGGAVGALYGAWVEIDDPPKKKGAKDEPKADPKPAPKKKG
jgi:hypothetical protein